MPDVLLATCAELPDGEWGAPVLDAALAARGISAGWAAWDDASVDWAGSLVAVRSTWDYDGRREEFLAWTRSLPRVLNGADAFAWNTDKAYLLDLARSGVPVVPSVLLDDLASLSAAVAQVCPDGSGRAVVKPRVAAGGRGLVVLEGTGGADALEVGDGPWLVQPLVESVRSEGETSVFVLGGEVVAQVRKRPGAGEVRVHPQYGGRSEVVALDDEAAGLARGAVAAAEQHLGHPLDYARVDALRLDGQLVVGEVELTEPGLYLEHLPANADAFADVLAARLRPS